MFLLRARSVTDRNPVHRTSIGEKQLWLQLCRRLPVNRSLARWISEIRTWQGGLRQNPLVTLVLCLGMFWIVFRFYHNSIWYGAFLRHRNRCT